MRNVKKSVIRRAAAPVVESIEQRMLMSGTVTYAVAGGVLTITGDSADNAITIEDTGVGMFSLTGTSGTSIKISGGATTAPDTPVAITLATGNLVMDFSQGGADTITAANKITLTDSAGIHSNLTFTGGTAGAKSLFKAISATGMVAFMNAGTGVSEVVDITSDNAATGGTWDISYNGGPADTFNFDDDISVIETALRLSTGDTGLTVLGNSMDNGGGAALTITFSDTFGDADAFTVDASLLTGATVTATVTETTKGIPVGAMASGTITISDSNSASATGGVTFLSQLVVGDRLTLNDGAGHIKTLQAVAAGATGLQFNIGGSKALTMANLVSKINALQSAGTLDITAVDAGAGVCTLTTGTAGALGNQPIIVSTFSRSRITATGMSGGGATNVTAGNTVTVDDGSNTPVVFTFGVGPTDVAIGATAAASATNLVAAINAAANLNVTAVDNGDGTIDLYADGAGSGYSVAKVGAQIAVGNFTGGVDWINVAAGDTVTLDDGINPAVTFTAVVAGPAADEFLIGGDAIATMANFVAAVNASTAIAMTAVDNGDGTCTLTADATGTIGNQAIGSSGTNIADADMAGGIGGALEVNDFTVTMGNGGNFVGFGAGFAGQSTATGNISITTGTGDDTIALLGADVFGTVTISAGAAATAAGDTISITDDGSVGTQIAGTLSVTQTTGVSTVNISNAAVIGSPLMVGGAVTINVGECASNSAVTTLDNVNFENSFTYTGGAGTDTLNMHGNSIVGTSSTITLGAGTNTFDVAGGVSLGMSSGTTALTYIGGAGSDTISMVATGTSEVQTLTPSLAAASGTWTLSYNGLTTGVMQYNATLADIQAALRGLAGCENVVVSGSTLDAGGDMIFTFGKTDGQALAISANVGSIRTAETITAPVVETAKGVAATVAEIQTLTPSDVASSGTWTLTYNTVTTAVLQYNATLGQIQAAIRAVAGCENVVVSGSTLDAGGDMIFTFDIGDGDALAITADVSAIRYAGTITAPVVETTVGVATGVVDIGAAVVINPGDGANSLTIDDAVIDGALTYAPGTCLTVVGTGAGADTITLGATSFTSTGAISLSVGAGANSLTIDNATLSGALTYTGGANADTVTLGANGTFVSRSTLGFTLGNGNNSVTADGRSKGITYAGGTGPDALTLGSKTATGGYALNGDLTMNAVTGTAGLTFDGTLRNLTYTGGAGADTILLGTDAGEHNFLAKGNVTVNAGNGANSLTATYANVRGTFSYGTAAAVTAGTGGTGVDTIVTGESLANALVTGLTVAKQTTIYTGGQADVIKINSSKLGTVSGTAITAPAAFIDAGAGDDQILIDAKGGGSDTYFYRGLQLIAGVGTADTDTITDTAHTYFWGSTAALKPSLSGVRNAKTLLNGSTTGTLLGVTFRNPLYA